MQRFAQSVNAIYHTKSFFRLKQVKKTFVPPVHSTGVRVEGKDAGEQAGNLLKLLSEAKITF